MNSRYTIFLASIATTFSTLISAQTTLDPVIITATRTVQMADDSLSPVTLINQEQIESSGATDLVELLAGHAGVEFSTNGGAGASRSIYMRGANSDGVLVLIDGIRVGSATTGQPSIEHYPIQQVQKIEVVRGPRSALYGSGAIGGVIHIFTKQGTKEPATTATVGYGNHRTEKGSISTSGAVADTKYAFSMSHYKTDGISAKTNKTNYDNDADGYENDSISLNLSSKFSPSLTAKVNWLYVEGTHESDGGIGAHSDSIEQVIGTSIDYAVNDSWFSKLKLGLSEDLSDSYTSNTSSKTVTNTRRDSVVWQNDVYLSEDIITLGIDYANDRISTSTNYGVKERDEKAMFGQYQWSALSSDWLLALRHLDNETFGSHNTGNIEFGRDIFDNLRFTAAYGEAFHAPDMNDLFYPSKLLWGTTYTGNSDLLPEESKSYEVGLRGRGGNYLWSLNSYKTTVKNLISWQKIGSTSSPANIGTAKMKGVELEVATVINSWNVKPSLSWLDAIDADTQKKLKRRAEWSYRVDLERRFGRYTAGINLHGKSHSYNDVDNDDRLGGFNLIDTRLDYELNNKTTLRANIKNLLDEKYETVKDYSSPDREIMLTVTYDF